MSSDNANIASDLQHLVSMLETKAASYRERIRMVSAHLALDVTRIRDEVSDTTKPFHPSCTARRAAEIDRESEGLYQTLASIKTLNQMIARANARA